MKRLAIVLTVLALSAVARDRLVHLLTRFTGTWVGTPK